MGIENRQQPPLRHLQEAYRVRNSQTGHESWVNYDRLSLDVKKAIDAGENYVDPANPRELGRECRQGYGFDDQFLLYDDAWKRRSQMIKDELRRLGKRDQVITTPEKSPEFQKWLNKHSSSTNTDEDKASVSQEPEKKKNSGCLILFAVAVLGSVVTAGIITDQQNRSPINQAKSPTPIVTKDNRSTQEGLLLTRTHKAKKTATSVPATPTNIFTRTQEQRATATVVKEWIVFDGKENIGGLQVLRILLHLKAGERIPFPVTIIEKTTQGEQVKTFRGVKEISNNINKGTSWRLP